MIGVAVIAALLAAVVIYLEVRASQSTPRSTRPSLDTRPQHDSLGIFVLHIDDNPTVPPPGKYGSAVQRLRDMEVATTAPDYLKFQIECEAEYAERLPAPPRVPIILPPPWKEAA